MSDFYDIDLTKKHGDKEICSAFAFQEASVCVPVEVIPYAKSGDVKVFCKGEPIIDSGCIECPGSIDSKCHFTITQKICVKVPVEFGANTLVGNPHIKCDKASSHNICKRCDVPDEALSQ